MKILVSLHTLPTINSPRLVRIQNIVDALKNKTDVELICLVSMPDPLPSIPELPPNVKVIDLHDYKNALDMIKEVNPDVIFSVTSYDLLSYSLSVVGKFLKIPVVGHVLQDWRSSTPLTLIKMLKQAFEKSTPTDKSENQKQFMRRGRFFLYRFLFALKTQHSIKMPLSERIVLSFLLLKHHLFSQILPMSLRIANDLHYVSNEKLIPKLLKVGFDKQTLILTGDPLFDKQFRRISKIAHKQDMKKTNILFAPSSLFEHGFCSKSEQDDAFISVVKEIHSKNLYNLTIKIHPSSAVFYHYRSLTDQVDPSIPLFQHGDISDYIDNADLIIVHPTTTMCIFSLIAKRPTITYNFLNYEGDVFADNNVIVECKEASSLLTHIDSALKNPISHNVIDKFLEDSFYKTDGLASERIADGILKLFEKRSNSDAHS